MYAILEHSWFLRGAGARRGVLRDLDVVAVTEIYDKAARAELAALCMLRLKDEGFTPDVIFTHRGWGQAYSAKDPCSDAKLLVYAEYF